MSCTPYQEQTGGCPSVSAELGGGAATLQAGVTGPGGGSGGSGNGGSGGSGNNGGGAGTGAGEVPGFSRVGFCAQPDLNPCQLTPAELVVAAAVAAAGTAPISLSDIASFRPDPGVDQMEPNGWMVVGLDTNFFASGEAQTKAGTLLGLPASVRFTPVRWHWSYGDGSTVSRATNGATWAAQGIREFEQTATSHVYGTAGTYYIDLDIDYRAEYRIGSAPWTPIAGTLRLPANRLVATAGTATTVLVERECTLAPSGPGC